DAQHHLERVEQNALAAYQKHLLPLLKGGFSAENSNDLDKKFPKTGAAIESALTDLDAAINRFKEGGAFASARQADAVREYLESWRQLFSAAHEFWNKPAAETWKSLGDEHKRLRSRFERGKEKDQDVKKNKGK